MSAYQEAVHYAEIARQENRDAMYELVLADLLADMRRSASARTEVAELFDTDKLDDSLVHLARGDNQYNNLCFAMEFVAKVFDPALKQAVERRMDAIKDAEFEREYGEEL